MTAHEFVKHQRWERPATIGFLGATKHSAWSEFITPFEKRLREQGWIDGYNLEIDDRCADVIVTAGTPAVAAAKRATKAIPIVFATAGDPARTGLVRSLAHPGG